MNLCVTRLYNYYQFPRTPGTAPEALPTPFVRCLYTGRQNSCSGCVLAVIILVSSVHGVSCESLGSTSCSPSLA